MADLTNRLQTIQHRLDQLPKGTLTYKKIRGKEQPYLQRTIDGRSVSYYIKTSKREQILAELEERKSLLAEQSRLHAYMKQIQEILQRNPYLDKKMSRGYQDFGEIMELKRFYVDKTYFIEEWWNSSEKVSLITRPRRFGKTLMLSTVEYFFSPEKAGHPEYFNLLSVWKNPDIQKLYGRIPVIFLSFGGAKGGSFRSAMLSIGNTIRECFSRYAHLIDSPHLSQDQKECFKNFFNQMVIGDYSSVCLAVTTLSEILEAHYKTSPIILLDEYDTPLTEAYTAGYWQEMIHFYRQFIHITFKQNGFFQKAVITGVAKISKNSLFSDMNNIATYSCTSNGFSDCFGFTEKEVMDALQCYDLDEMSKVKEMYDGFIFGDSSEIYNPWSICNFMVEQELSAYWVNTSSNELIGDLIRKVPAKTKKEVEDLILGKKIHKYINEDIALQYADGNEEAFWSLLLATGYIKASNVKKTCGYTECDVAITNMETMFMFHSQILGMFPLGRSVCQEFVDALLNHKLEELNVVLNDILLTSISYFDTGKRPSEKAPENFFHGLILGLIVSLKDRYRITSNRESGLGRYDLAIVPIISKNSDAFILEFKVRNPKKEETLEDTAKTALLQIREKRYEQEILAQGISKEQIYSLGFAFDGKEALVIEDH